MNRAAVAFAVALVLSLAGVGFKLSEPLWAHASSSASASGIAGASCSPATA